MSNLAKGTLIINEYGNGFVNLNSFLCVYIPKKNLGNAYNNETVLIEYYKENNKYYGKVVDYSLVNKVFIGRVHHYYKTSIFIYCDELKQLVEIETDFYLEKGDWIEIKIVDDADIIRGIFIKKLDNNVDDLIEKKYKLSQININPNDLLEDSFLENDNTKHIDLSEELEVFTIDPPNSQDCDDAFSIHKKSNGIYIIYVHISDTAHYINPKLENFEEIMERGNTFYGKSRNWTIIPRLYADNICSILPNKKTKVVTHEYIYNSVERTLKFDRWYYSIIESKWKLNYDYVDSLLEDKEDSEMVNNMRILFESSRIIKNGIKDFSVARETKAHEMVKYWMIYTNNIMGELINKIYRYNPCPPKSKTQLLSLYLEYKYGYNIDMTNREDLYRIYNKCNEMREDKLLGYLMKSMLQKAYYGLADSISDVSGSLNHFHYGMGISGYTHFTSPIRRSSDLLCHLFLKGYKNLDYAKYLEIANRQEMKQDEIEMFIEQYENTKKGNIGNIYKGIIIGITRVGICVYIDEFDNRFNVHISKLSGEKLNYDDKREMLYNDKVRYMFFSEIKLVLRKIDIKQILEFDVLY